MVWRNLLFTPALYSCSSDVVVMLISVLAGAKRTSPLATASLWDPVCIVPSPTVTKKTEGPDTAGNTDDAPLGRMQQSTSNSSKGGRYLVMYGLRGNPFRISGKPWKRNRVKFNFKEKMFALKEKMQSMTSTKYPINSYLFICEHRTESLDISVLGSKTSPNNIV